MLYDILAPYYSVAIAGMSKNAGKTTVLNHLIAAAQRTGAVLGLTSIGYDGEDTDLVTNTQKPNIFVPRGTLFATAAGLLPGSDVTREILGLTASGTPLGRVVLARARSAGNILLAGPSVTDELPPVITAFRAHGAGRVFVDGALNRRAFCSGDTVDATVLCTGASYSSDIQKVLLDTLYILSLFSLPLYGGPPVQFGSTRFLILSDSGEPLPTPPDEVSPEQLRSLPDGTARLHIAGALTDRMAQNIMRLPRTGREVSIICRDASRLLLSRESYERLVALGYTVLNERSTSIVALCVNPVSAYGYSFDGRELTRRLREHTDIFITDVIGDNNHIKSGGHSDEHI